MAEDKYHRRDYQNFVINWDQFYDRSGWRLTDPLPDYYESDLNVITNGEEGFIPFECWYTDNIPPVAINRVSGGRLDVYFRVNLSPQNMQPDKIEIRNINSSFNAAGGYLFELSCPTLLRTPIHFLDSQSAFVVYEQHTNEQLPSSSLEFRLRRITGSVPLPYRDNDEEDTQYLINPSLSFTIVYHYY